MHSLIGAAWMVVAALFYGSMNICLKQSGSHLTVWQTAMGRFVLGAAFAPVLIRLFRMQISGKERWLLLARGLSGTIGFLLFIQAMKMLPLSMTMVLFYLWPVFTCLLSSWIAGEPTRSKEWILVIGTLLGTATILWPDRAGQGLNPGYLLVLASSFFTGLAITLIRRLRRLNNPLTIYFYFCLTGALATLGPLFSQDRPLSPPTPKAWLLLCAIAVFAMLGQVFMNQGMKYLNASRTGVLMMIEVIVAGTFGAFWLGEVLSIRFLFGSALILACGATLMALPPKAPAIAPPEV